MSLPTIALLALIAVVLVVNVARETARDRALARRPVQAGRRSR